MLHKIPIYILFLNIAGTASEEKLNEIKILPSTSLQAIEGESKAADCTLSHPSGVPKIEWTSPRNEIIESDLNRTVYVEEENGEFTRTSRLIFANLTQENGGTYTCRVLFGNMSPVISEKFDLQVLKKYRYEFEDDEKIYYGSFGNAVTLQCRRKGSTVDTIGSISWNLNNQPITTDEKDFVIMDDEEKLWIKKVSNETLGNYSCTWVEPDTGNVVEREMELRLARAPRMIPVHMNNTVHVPILQQGYMAELKCRVDSNPLSSFTWIRYNGKLEYNITFEENYSELYLPITSRSVLGTYLCQANNSIGTSSVTIEVVEAEMPKVPKVHQREGYENGYRLDIDQSAEQNLSNYRVQYRKRSDVSGNWSHHDFQIRDSKTLPYSINGLEPNQEYVFKVGACTFYDLCAYAEESTFKTTEFVTSAGIRTLRIQLIVFTLLPTFITIYFSKCNIETFPQGISV